MLLQVKGMNKRFVETYALKDVDIDIRPGEVHGLVGENGAGKSTLIKILTGVYSMDSGEIWWDGKKVSVSTPHGSRKLGINVIHQDRHLVPSFNGIENMYLGLRYDRKGIVVDWAKMRQKAQSVLETYGIDVDISLPASDLTPPQRTMLEIARAMMVECRLLILDEPSASLTDKEAEALFSIIERLKNNGTAILYVSHRMDEIFKLTDRITVLKNGEFVDTVKTSDTNKEHLISLMTDNWKSVVTHNKSVLGKPLLQIENISSKDGIVKDASFTVHSGEILGVFGLGGSGRTELMECIYGHRTIKSGNIDIDGQRYAKPTARKSLAKGLVLICEDRRGMAIVPTLNVKQNMVLSTIDNYSTFLGITSEKRELRDVKDQIERFKIKTRGPSQPILQCSGGNQQKVVFAKALLSSPKILLCDEPTQAVDVKTRQEIHILLRELADKGNAVVFVSSDLKEVLEVADNIQIFSEGFTREHFKNENINAEDVLAYCFAHLACREPMGFDSDRLHTRREIRK